MRSSTGPPRDARSAGPSRGDAHLRGRGAGGELTQESDPLYLALIRFSRFLILAKELQDRAMCRNKLLYSDSKTLQLWLYKPHLHIFETRGGEDVQAPSPYLPSPHLQCP